MKTPLLAATLLGALVLVSACNRNPSTTDAPRSTAPAPVDQPKQAVTDTVLTTKVKAALLATNDVNSTSISVETRDGTVTLSGRLPDAAQIERAVTAARAVDGVRNVDNRLAVGTS